LKKSKGDNMNYYTTIRKDKVEKIKNFIDKLVPIEAWAENIILPYIGGKICYNKDFNVTKFDFHNEEVYTYLKKISNNNHLSIFEHDIVTIDLMEYINTTKNFQFTMKDIFSYFLDESSDKFIEFLPDVYTHFPVYSNVTKHTDMVNDVFCKFMGFILHEHIIGSAKCGDKISINLRSYLEMCKILNCEEEFWGKMQEVSVNSPIVDSTELKNGGILHIVRIDNSQIPIASFIVEGGSIILEKQMIRHRYQTSYSISSFRYNNAEDSQFVMPFSHYIDKFSKEEYQEIVEMYGVICSSSLDVYKNFIEKNIKKEDARFVIPVGCCTNIMCTSMDIGLKNLIEMREDKNTVQWEINEIATIIKEKLKDSE